MDSWRRRAEGALLALLLIGVALLPADAQEGWRAGLSPTRAGADQIVSADVLAAANTGDVLLFTGAVAPFFIDGCLIRSNGATTLNLTSAAVYISGVTNHAQELIPAANATQAALAAEGNIAFGQGGPGVVYPGEIIEIDLQGSGATVVDLTVWCGGDAFEDGGMLQ